MLFRNRRHLFRAFMRAGKAADSIGRFCALPLFAVFDAAAFASDFFKSAKNLKSFLCRPLLPFQSRFERRRILCPLLLESNPQSVFAQRVFRRKHYVRHAVGIAGYDQMHAGRIVRQLSRIGHIVQMAAVIY